MKKGKIMVRFLVASIFTIILFEGVGYSQDIRAKTEDGREVILKKDGTWEFPKASKSVPATAGSYQKSSSAKSVFKTRGERFLVWYDPLIWKQSIAEEAGRTQFVQKDGDVYALVIAERLDISTEALRELAITHAQKASPDIRVTREEYRQVNGKKVLLMEMAGTVQKIPFAYLGYYFGGKGYTIQLLTYTSQQLYQEYKSEMETFLNGLIINE